MSGYNRRTPGYEIGKLKGRHEKFIEELLTKIALMQPVKRRVSC